MRKTKLLLLTGLLLVVATVADRDRYKDERVSLLNQIDSVEMDLARLNERPAAARIAQARPGEIRQYAVAFSSSRNDARNCRTNWISTS